MPFNAVDGPFLVLSASHFDCSFIYDRCPSEALCKLAKVALLRLGR